MMECGGCTLCCRLTAIPEFEKPFGVWCRYCEIGKFCSIYTGRPPSCEKFECSWLREGWPQELRPDKCHLMFEQIPGSPAYVATREPEFPNAWLGELQQKKMREIADNGNPVVIRTSRKTVQILTPENMSAKEVWEELKKAFGEL